MKFKYKTLLRRRDELDKKIKHLECMYSNVSMPSSLRTELHNLKFRLSKYDHDIMAAESEIAAKGAADALAAARAS